jgi:hypothetical protein
MTFAGGRALIVAVVLSVGLHGLLVLALCLCRGPAFETEKVPATSSADRSEWATPHSTLRLVRRPVAPSETPATTDLEITYLTPPKVADVEPPPLPTVVGRDRPPTVAMRPTPQTTPASGPTAAGGSQQGTAEKASAGSEFFGSNLGRPGSEIKSIVFVLDRSLSMGLNGGIQRARAEICGCLKSLPATTRFQVIAYDDAPEASPLELQGRRDLLTADPATIEAIVERVDALRAQGGTNHLAGLACGLGLRPEIVVFVTDADDFGAAEGQAALRLNAGHCQIQVIHLTTFRGGEENLRRLAEQSGGTYRKIRPDQHVERTQATGSTQAATPRRQ